jgi:hypothetical protein
MKIGHLAVVIGLSASLAACAASAPPRAAAAPHAPGQGSHPAAGCPLGRPLPPGEGIAIDYVDFIWLAGRSYLGEPGPITRSQLSRVISHVRCSLTAEEDGHRGSPPMVNGTASFLRAGAAVYKIRGYAPGCRVAAYLRGRLHVYLAQRTAHGSQEPAPCPPRRDPARQSAGHG